MVLLITNPNLQSHAIQIRPKLGDSRIQDYWFYFPFFRRTTTQRDQVSFRSDLGSLFPIGSLLRL